MKLDIVNAFNAVDRGICLSQIREHAPNVSKWIEWCYVNPSRLLFGKNVISSETGVQQGDPFSFSSKTTIDVLKNTIFSKDDY